MDFQVKQIFKKISTFLKRFHVIIFVVSVFGGLAVAVFILSTILQSSADVSSNTPTPSNLSPNFDQETIDRLSELRTNQDSSSPIELPPGRINPFAE